MGVSGSGKTTVGETLAQQLGWKFADADDYHPAANIAKMSAGIPLTDEDRAPWLESLRRAIAAWLGAKENTVLACSALKRSYREVLMINPEVRLVYLRGSFSLIEERMRERHGHYMKPGMLESQFEALEEPLEPEHAIAIDVNDTVPDIVAKIRSRLGL